jgi:hypothetical protein
MIRIVLLALLALPALGAAPAYHLELEANPGAPFPYLAKFGTVHLHAYPGGVRANTFWLDAFSRKGSNDITVMNPVARMYAEIPIADIAAMVSRLGGWTRINPPSAPPMAAPLRGKVKEIDATRYRLIYGPDAWIDVWTTTAIPNNAQFKRIVYELVAAISPSSALTAQRIPGMPIYVELNFTRYKKLQLVRMKKLEMDSAGEADALTTGSFYMKAPLADAIFK